MLPREWFFLKYCWITWIQKNTQNNSKISPWRLKHKSFYWIEIFYLKSRQKNNGARVWNEREYIGESVFDFWKKKHFLVCVKEQSFIWCESKENNSVRIHWNRLQFNCGQELFKGKKLLPKLELFFFVVLLFRLLCFVNGDGTFNLKLSCVERKTFLQSRPQMGEGATKLISVKRYLR